jgi:hypothetical protein
MNHLASSAAGFPSEALLPRRPASLGEILDAGFVLFKGTLIGCVPFSLVAVLLGHLPSVYQLLTGQALALDESKDLLWWLLMLVAGLGTLCMWLIIMLRQRAALAAAASQGNAGGVADDVFADVMAAVRLLPRALLLLLLAAVAIALGGVLLVLPGIYLLVAFWPALAIQVFEGRGIRDSLDGALQLVRGEWRHVAMTLVVVAMSVLALFVIGSLCGLLLFEITGRADLAKDPLASGLVAGLLGALFQPLVIAFTLASYADLRHRKA